MKFMNRYSSVASLLMAFTLGLPAFAAEPLKWGSALLEQKPDWYASPAARAAADRVLQYQSSLGAWPKNTDLLAEPTAEILATVESGGRANTIDNGATTTPMQFLALVNQALPDERYRAAVVRGVNYLLACQYPNGGFPQFFPLKEGYYSHITYNDGAMVNVLELLREVAAARAPYGFLDDALRARAADAVARGTDCILRTQIRQGGVLTAWCAQHDEKTLEPAWARKYEPPSLSGGETVGIVGFLMAVEQPTPGIIAAVEGAVAWLRQVEMHGVRVVAVRGPDGRLERSLTADPAAPPLWARFYELGTNRPLYLDRDSVFRYNFAEIGYERRSGYNYHGTWAARLLETGYPRWRQKHSRI